MADAKIQTGPTLKLTTIGDGTVGKTSLLISYTTGEFPEEYVPTVFDNYAGTHEVQGKQYNVSLWDTAGQEEYERLRPLSYPGTSAFIICFAFDNKTSYDNVVSKWLPEIKYHCPSVPAILVGTKKDLITSNSGLTSREGKRLVKKENLAKFVECSAKTQEGISEVFTEAVLAAISAPKKVIHCCFL